jgi:Prokaryotic homologs of the JAB domain
MPRRFGLTASEMHQLHEVGVVPEVRLALLSATRAAIGEACAALYGTADGPVLTVGGWRHLENTEPGTCFAISVADLLADDGALGAAGPRGAGPINGSAGPGAGAARQRLVGLFHSHPRSPAVPSELDCLGIARLPFVWAIAGLNERQGESLRFFAWSLAGVRELPERGMLLGACRPGGRSPEFR